MTKRQIKICKCVMRYKKLNTVLRKCNIPDYLEIQYVLGTVCLSNENVSKRAPKK